MTSTFDEIVKDLDDIEVPEEPKKGNHFSHPNRSDIGWCGAKLSKPTKPPPHKEVPEVECEHCMYLLQTVGGREYFFQRGKFGWA